MLPPEEVRLKRMVARPLREGRRLGVSLLSTPICVKSNVDGEVAGMGPEVLGTAFAQEMRHEDLGLVLQLDEPAMREKCSVRAVLCREGSGRSDAIDRIVQVSRGPGDA